MTQTFRTWLRENENQQDFDDEDAWAAEILNNDSKLEDFKYFQDYVKTVAQEAPMLHGKVLFIGGGPVPLTPILLYKNHGIKADIMDYNAAAVRTGQMVLQKLQVPLRVFAADATTFQGYKNYQSIVVSLEAGNTMELKQRIFDNLKSQIDHNTVVLIRGSNANDAVDGTSYTNVEGYVQNYFNVVRRVPVFSNLSTSYLLHCNLCPINKKTNQPQNQPQNQPMQGAAA